MEQGLPITIPRISVMGEMGSGLGTPSSYQMGPTLDTDTPACQTPLHLRRVNEFTVPVPIRHLQGWRWIRRAPTHRLVSYGKRPEGMLLLWARQDSNLQPTDYETV